MPRYRKLHTKTLESLDVNDMPDDFTRLLWVLLPLVLCREGRGLNNAAWLRSKLFPLREDVAQEQVAQAFDWCVQRGMIVTYTVDGRDYFYVPSFHTYQGSTLKEAESDYPAPQSPVQTNSRPTPELVQSKSATDTDTIFNMQYTDADTTAISETDVVAVLKSFGMSTPAKVMDETRLTPFQIIETVRYAEQEGLKPGWVRKQLRNNEAHQPRAPDGVHAINVCPKCSAYPCMCEELP